jgi:Xaa-Pro aminopeptidase
MQGRVDRLLVGLEEPLLVTNPLSVAYLVGFRSSNAALLVEPERTRLFTDFRYLELARGIPGVEVEQVSRSLLHDIAPVLGGRVGFEAEYTTYADWETLRAGAAELVPRRGLVERLRAVKDADELATIRRAAAIASRAFARFSREHLIGRTERELAWRMEELLHLEGAEGIAFDVIVASGPNAARPHAEPGGRKVESRETVVVDAGARLDGYHSDCTRTFATGPLPERLRDAYVTCLDAQLLGLETVRPGVSGREADARVRAHIDATAFRGTFGHGLGHGVGLDIHEAPALRPESTDTLEPGNVVSVEPGIYLEGEGGIRIEDLVVVTEDGCEVLTRFPKDLLEVD